MALHPASRRVIHPVHAVLLAAILPCFLGALLADLAYDASYQIQWTNFASWLVAAGLVFGGLALLWAAVDLLRAEVRRERLWVLYFIVLLVTWIVGFINALVHAKDAYAAMPGGLILSIVALVLAFAAIWLGFSSLRAGGVK